MTELDQQNSYEGGALQHLRERGKHMHANPQCYGTTDDLVERSKAIQARLRERARQPETAQDRRHLLIWLRSCAIGMRAKIRGVL